MKRERRLSTGFGDDLEIWKRWNFSAPSRKYYKKLPLLCFIIFFWVLPLPRNFSASERKQRTNRWVFFIFEKSWTMSRSWEAERVQWEWKKVREGRKGLVRSGNKVKRWERESIISDFFFFFLSKIIFEKLKSTKDIKNRGRPQEMWKYKKWIKEME